MHAFVITFESNLYYFYNYNTSWTTNCFNSSNYNLFVLVHVEPLSIGPVEPLLVVDLGSSALLRVYTSSIRPMSENDIQWRNPRLQIITSSFGYSVEDFKRTIKIASVTLKDHGIYRISISARVDGSDQIAFTNIKLNVVGEYKYKIDS